MDVRCEKCQTEYELDESRLKPGGVTVKCTNCGHMFKIRKRVPTNVGIPAVSERARTQSSKSPPISDRATTRSSADEPAPAPVATPDSSSRGDSVLADVGALNEMASGPVERQWLIRLDNGETRSCRELSMLQQWIGAGIVSRESLISRTGKTWKRLGDIPELAQYFVSAEEARPRSPRSRSTGPVQPTVLGVSSKPAVAGGTVLPDDDKPAAAVRAAQTTPPPVPTARISTTNPNHLSNPATAQTELAPTTPAESNRRISAPSAPPVKAPELGRSTAAWVTDEVKQRDSMAGMPQGPRGGKLAAAGDEPAFSGRVRLAPGSESAFDTGRIRPPDDDDDMMLPQRGSRAGMWLVALAMLAIGAAAGTIYMFAIRPRKEAKQAPPAVSDAANQVAAVTPPDAATAAPPPADAAAAIDPLDAPRAELIAGVESRVKAAFDGLQSQTDPASLALRARLATELAQSYIDRAGLLADKAEGDKLRKQAKQIVVDAAPIAQRAFKAQADDPSANLAMAEVLRLQGKSPADVQRYLDTAMSLVANPARHANPSDQELRRSIALSEALLAAHAGTAQDAAKALGMVAQEDDPRVKFELALLAFTRDAPKDAQPFVDQILAEQPDHDGARALQKRLETMVAKTDPLPPEDGKQAAQQQPKPGTHAATPLPAETGGSYEAWLARANKLAESNCAKAIDLYAKALEQKPNGVEALTGMGYCNLDAKQFSSAFSKFRTALVVSSRFEPALAGIAETYQQQGNKDQAIAAWRSYLEAFPGSAKAKRQLEILGASGDGSSPPVPKQPAPAPPAPAPAEPAPAPSPAPTPATDNGAGNGSS